ncbi:MAG: ATP-dependent DNA helicase RecG, partial [Candidatus Giovannonibacteria bacterium GW2011_GWA2_53_7]
GLSQLHQFRGRVGRSPVQSYCFCFSDESEGGQANPRLKAFTETTDGFALAEADLKLRGPGELKGGRQSGLPDFQMASLHDIELIKRAREAAKRLLEDDPKLDKAPLLKRIIEADREIHWE